MINCLFLTLTLLFLAHLIADFTPLIPFKKQILDAKINGGKDKWIYVHGLTVASYKVIAIIISNMILLLSQFKPFLFKPWFVIMLVIFFIIESSTHFIIDVCKTDFNLKYNLKCDTNETYWIAVGIDQFLHAIVMFGICYCLYG